MPLGMAPIGSHFVKFSFLEGEVFWLYVIGYGAQRNYFED